MSSIGCWTLLHALEIGRVLYVGRAVAPLEGHAALDRDLAPVRLALEHVAVLLREQVLGDGLADDARDLAAGRPDVAQVHLLALVVGAERRAHQIDIHVAGERIGDNERRGSEVVRAHVRVHAALEVAVARKHRGRDDVVLVDRLGELFRQRPGVADAAGAAEADQIEADAVEILLQTGLVEILGDDLASPARARSSPRASASVRAPQPSSQATPPQPSRSGSTCWCRM